MARFTPSLAGIQIPDRSQESELLPNCNDLSMSSPRVKQFSSNDHSKQEPSTTCQQAPLIDSCYVSSPKNPTVRYLQVPTGLGGQRIQYRILPANQVARQNSWVSVGRPRPRGKCVIFGPGYPNRAMSECGRVRFSTGAELQRRSASYQRIARISYDLRLRSRDTNGALCNHCRKHLVGVFGYLSDPANAPQATGT